jgi:hypothetical protein
MYSTLHIYLKAGGQTPGRTTKRANRKAKKGKKEKRKFSRKEKKKPQSCMLPPSSLPDSRTALPHLTEGSNEVTAGENRNIPRNRKRKKQRVCARGTMLGG